ncbi:MAG: tetratricopeptide repeat protein [bacterium]
MGFTLLVAGLGYRLSGGYPWGVDDGVKRLMAKEFAASGGRSLLLNPASHESLNHRFFPIPPPFMSETESGFRGVFPALFPVLGGVTYSLVGSFAFYLLPAACFTGFLFSLWNLLRKRPLSAFIRLWVVFILAALLFFYGLIFWEHALALLLLTPLLALVVKTDEKSSKWFWTGLCLGIGVYLRPEMLFLLPGVFAVFLCTPGRQWGNLLRLVLGGALILFAALLLERTLTGRWFPAQIHANVELTLHMASLSARLQDLLTMLFQSPLTMGYYWAGIGVISFFAIALRRWQVLMLGLPLLSALSLIVGLIHHSPFALTASTQGLLFACPWLILGMLPIAGKDRRRHPYLIIGGIFLLLALLFGPLRAGMHWGPRFLLPGILCGCLYVAEVLKGLPSRAVRLVILTTGLAALLFAIAGVFSIGERGAATRRVADLFQSTDTRIVVLDRWHSAADLEPLWRDRALLWIQSRGDAEELLLSLQELGLTEKLGWLIGSQALRLNELPLRIQGQHKIQPRGGWEGEFYFINATNTSDIRWGMVYWHAALRRAEAGQPAEALNLFERALDQLPENADLRYDFAVCLGRAGLVAEAFDQLQKVLELNPGHAPAGLMLRRLSAGR